MSFVPFFLKKYLFPQKRHVAVSLISFISVLVISLITWLIILFLSVTEGLEKKWLDKLTSLNGQIKIIPTENYYNSYYYQKDAFLEQAGFRTKTLKEKLLIELAEKDQENVSDEASDMPDFLVKKIFSILDQAKVSFVNEYNTAAGVVKIHSGDEASSMISQASYFTNFSGDNPIFQKTIEQLSKKDIYPLLEKITFFSETEQKRILYNLRNIQVKLSANEPISLRNIDIHSPLPLEITKNADMETVYCVDFDHVHHVKLLQKDKLYYLQKGEELEEISPDTPVFFSSDTICTATIEEKDASLVLLCKSKGASFQTSIDAVRFIGATPVVSFQEKPEFEPLWLYLLSGQAMIPANSILIPKQFKDQKVHIGSSAAIHFDGTSLTQMKDMKLPCFVSGFYDPGIFTLGNKVIYTNDETVLMIQDISHMQPVDPLFQNGINIWVDNIAQTPQIEKTIQTMINKNGLSPFFQVIAYYDFPFAKDFIQQFQSDQTLFTLVGIIVIMVAASNIMSMLFLLIYQKKHEIGVFLTLGAKKSTIVLLFSLVGFFLGLVSIIIGMALSYITLKNMPMLAAILSKIQGHDIFNTLFYGSSLPSDISTKGLLFTIFLTIIVSITSALIPALRAAKIKPVDILKEN